MINQSKNVFWNLLISHMINMNSFKLKKILLKWYGVGGKKNAISVPREKCIKIPQAKGRSMGRKINHFQILPFNARRNDHNKSSSCSRIIFIFPKDLQMILFFTTP